MHNIKKTDPTGFSLARKSDAIGYFAFTDSLFRKFPAPAIVLPSGENQSLRGVFFHGKHAYVSNNSFAGRVVINDNFPLMNQVAFYSFADDLTQHDPDFLANGRVAKMGLLTKHNVHTIDQLFDSHAKNTIFLDRQKLMACLAELPPKYRATGSVSALILGGKVQLQLSNASRQVSLGYEFPLSPIPGRTSAMAWEESKFSVNMLVFERIVDNGFFFCDIIGIRFTGDSSSPVVLFNNNKRHQKTTWALTQGNIRRR